MSTGSGAIHVDSNNAAITYALTYSEALSIAEELGWTKTPSWAKGNYITSSPNKKLCELLLPFAMTAEKWIEKIQELDQPRS